MKTIINNLLAVSILFLFYISISRSTKVETTMCYPITVEVMEIEFPKTEDSSVNFYDLLGQYESSNNYNRVNTLGYLGKYQFGMSTLEWIGINTTKHEFLNSPSLQEKAVRKYVEVNKNLLQEYISNYSDRYFITYDGRKIFITETGILAGAHLGGHGSVKKFFDTQGKVNRKDAYGTSLLTYIETFSETKI